VVEPAAICVLPLNGGLLVNMVDRGAEARTRPELIGRQDLDSGLWPAIEAILPPICIEQRFLLVLFSPSASPTTYTLVLTIVIQLLVLTVGFAFDRAL